MNKLTKFLTEPFLQEDVLEEGINDPGILKAVFLAGGPGSGKSFVASGLYGIPKKRSVSAYGLKMINTDSELERMLNKYGFGTDLDDMPEELFRQLTDPKDDDYSGLRTRAQELTTDRKKMYANGRLGMVIDGTGSRFQEIKADKKELEEIGYDCYMVFVYTDLEVAQKRNMERPRKLNPELVESSWNAVQKNKIYFQGLFGNENFMMVDNSNQLSEKQAQKKFNMLVKKGIGKFINKPVKNYRGKNWIKKQKIMKESINVPVEIGDTILMGRFKNKKVVVKSIDYNEKGDLLINGRTALKFRIMKKEEVARKPRKKGQHRNSSSHSDLYTDENPKGTIKGLKFATVKDANASVSKIKGSGKSHAHKIQAAVAMEQRAKEMGKSSQAAVYRAYINKMKKKTKSKNEGWSAKYKKSIDCNNPKGFSQKAHCAGKKKTESVVPSPSRKMVKKMKKRGNTSVPYGSGYEKVSEAQAVKGSKVEKFITGHNLKMKGKRYKEIEFETLKVDNSRKMITLRILAPKNLFGMETPVKFSTLRRGPFTKTDTGKKLKEQKEIKKTIGVFGGRFQPFHSGHLATYKWMKSKFDEVYITTSNLKQPPRHPMDFKEKVRHMTKMGIPKNRIVMEKSPYVAKNLLSKFDKDTTAVVYAFGEKDAGRLKAGKGKYFQDYKKNQGNINGYEENGYFVTAPQQGSMSGTKMRQILGNPKTDDSERQKLFKKSFGYYDKGVYTMMTNKFKKLFESFKLNNDLIEEFLLESSTTTLSPTDDGPPTFYKGFNDYTKMSKKWIDNMYKGAGWKVLQFILGKHAINPEYDYTLNYNIVPAVAYGKKQSGEYGTRFGVNNPIQSYKDYIDGTVLKNLGYEIVKWMGITSDGKSYTGVEVETAVLPGIGDDNVGNTKKKKLKIKEKINLNDEVKLLIEGGAYGHLNHPFDNKNLTFSDFKTLIINTLQGNLDSEGAVTEKTDGQNIMVSWKGGKLLAARNKGHIKNHGANALSIDGIKSMFAGRGDIEKAFVYAMRDLQNAVGKLSKAQKDKIFDEGKKFMSLEVIYPKTVNVIPYGKSLLQFHGTIEYDKSGIPIGEDRGSARVLAGMIKQINQDVQKAFNIEKPFITNLPKVKDFSKRQSYFLGKLNKLQSEYDLKGSNTLADYHQAHWMEYIYNGAKQSDYKNISNKILMNLTKRWAFLDKSYKIPMIKKDLKEYPRFLNWVLNTDKMDHARLQKEHIRDWEVLFFELGAEILSNLSDFIAANPSKAAQQIRKDLKSAISKVRTSKDTKVLTTLKTQLDRLNAIGGLKSVVPSEGITFVFKGKLYKYTGAFAPANQILGMLKFV